MGVVSCGGDVVIDLGERVSSWVAVLEGMTEGGKADTGGPDELCSAQITFCIPL